MDAKAGHYRRLGLMVLLSFAAIANVQMNFNQAYMAALMAAPMLAIELALMGSMYPDKRPNAALVVAGLVVLVAAWALIRDQSAIGDRQFLRSMIPHHAGAILMCKEAPIADPEVKDLCRRIIASQESEIREMKTKLARL